MNAAYVVGDAILIMNQNFEIISLRARSKGVPFVLRSWLPEISIFKTRHLNKLSFPQKISLTILKLQIQYRKWVWQRNPRLFLANHPLILDILNFIRINRCFIIVYNCSQLSTIDFNQFSISCSIHHLYVPDAHQDILKSLLFVHFFNWIEININDQKYQARE